jgi:hypothetical protein
VGLDVEEAHPLDEAAFEPDLDLIEGLGVVADLDAAASEPWADLIAVAEQGEDAGLVGRAVVVEEECLAQQLLVGVAHLVGARAPPFERLLVGLGVDSAVVLGIGPGQERLVDRVEGGERG